MTKQEFLAELREKLKGLPEQDLEERLSFYSESIEDRMEDGLSEEEAVAGVGTVEEIVAQALTFGGYEKHYSYYKRPEVHVMQDDEVVCVDGVEVRCIHSHHAIEGRSYRFTNPATGGSFAYSGDTAPYEEFGEFAKGCSVVIHEASFDVRDTPEDNPYCHSSCMDAARAAVAAGAKTLYMVHAREETREATEKKAATLIPDARRPYNGDAFEF